MNIVEWIKENSTLVLLLVGGLLVGILFLKKTPPQATASPVAPADLSGLATDASGHPIVYRTASDTFITENISGSYNSATAADNAPATVGSTTVGSTSSTNTSTQTTDNHSQPIEHPIEPTPHQQMAFIRARFSSPLTKDYDTRVPQGVPLRSSPAGKQIGYVPYGSSIAVSGTAVSGGSNFPSSVGSHAWIPVTGGYVSAFDVTSIQ